MAHSRRSPSPFLLLLLHYILSFCNGDDVQALLQFKEKSDSEGKLASWNPSDDPNPCSGNWFGVTCSSFSSSSNRVTHLVLENFSLSGSAGLHILTANLNQLRVLSLKSNFLSGDIPPLNNLTNLKLLFLSNNKLTGSIPNSLGTLNRLHRIDLSSNALSGGIPTGDLNKLSHLLTLRLDQNKLTGSISHLRIPNLKDLNVSSNLLSGVVPHSPTAFPPSAFHDNPGLCGPPLSSVCESAVKSNPTQQPGSETKSPGAETAVVSSSPVTAVESGRKGGRMSRAGVIAIVVGDFVVLILITALLSCYFWKHCYLTIGHNRRQLKEGEKIVYSSSPYSTATGGTNTFHPPPHTFSSSGKMVFFEYGAKRFELEDLLRASAEMLGKGGSGTTYKAVLEDGNVVVVKRLRDGVMVRGGNLTGSASGVGKREFEEKMEVLGRLRHPNVVGLKAFYYARDEKLLVYEFFTNGSLFSLLHGNRGPGRTPLEWETRVRIAAGAARGLAYLHHKNRKHSHGNIKASNILIDKSNNAAISDYGLSSPLYGPSSTSSSTHTTRPKPTHKSDIYAFGVVLLELLTGKYHSPEVANGGVVDLPRWVQSVVREEWTSEVFDLELMKCKDVEEEMVGMLQIAMACTSTAVDQRPKMGHVVKMIEEIRGSESSPSYESSSLSTDSASLSES